MENSGNKNVTSAVIGIFVFIIVCLIGIMVYDKFINKEVPPENNMGFDTKEFYYKIFTEEMDKNVTFKQENIDNDEMEAEVTTYTYGKYAVKHYSYEGGADVNSIEIYKGDKLEYSKNDVKTAVLDVPGAEDSYGDVTPHIVNGVLYFISYSNKCYEKSEEENVYYLDFYSIDLTKDTINANKIGTYLLNVEGSMPNCETSNAISLTGSVNTVKLDSTIRSSGNLDNILSRAKFYSTSANIEDGKISLDIEDEDEGKTKTYVVKSLSDVVAVDYVQIDGSDCVGVNAYALTSDGKLYQVDFCTHYNTDNEVSINKYDVSNVESFTIIVSQDDSNELEYSSNESQIPTKYVIFKTKNGKYYTDYYDDKVSEVTMDKDGYDIKVLDYRADEKAYSGNEDLNNIKTELNKKLTKIEVDKEEETNGVLRIESNEDDNHKVVFEVTYPDFHDSDILRKTRFVMTISNFPASIYMNQGLGGEDSYPVEIFIMDDENNIYVANFSIRDFEDSPKSIYKIK